MKIKSKENKFECTFTEEELIIIKNSMAEVCFGLDVYEFQTRLGHSRDRVSKFAKAFSQSLRDMGIEE